MTKFERQWLAEAIRLREEHEGPLADDVAVREALAGGGGLHHRIESRAVSLGVATGLFDALRTWRRVERWALLGWLGFGFVSGLGLAWAVLGSGAESVNLLAASVGLLGVNALTMLVWIVTMALGGASAGGLAGLAWRALPGRLLRAPQALLLGRARMALLAQQGALRWWFASITHLFWVALLVGVLARLLFAFSFQQYDFAWQTTILPAEVFSRVAVVMGDLPGRLGWPMPAASELWAAAAPEASVELGRAAWANWLLACVIFYGLLPRVALWVASVANLRWRRGRFSLDLDRPGYIVLRERLQPASARIGVSDAAPAAVHRRVHRSGVSPLARASPTLVAVEMRSEASWPPPLPVTVVDAGRVDERHDRRRALATFAEAPPVRLLIACDPALSPDRGSLGLITELASHAAACRVWLVGGAQAADRVRLEHWLEGLRDCGFDDQEIVVDRSRALAWLEHGDA